jgi:hypothetical protein
MCGPPRSASSRSMPCRSRRTGKMLVNHPTVRERSMSSKISSRPWPSRSKRTPEACSDERLRRQWATANAKAVSSTSLMRPWKSAGTCVSSAEVSALGRLSVRRRAVATVSRAASSGRWDSSGSDAPTMDCHNGSSASRRAESASAFRRSAQCRRELPRGPSLARSLRCAARQASSRSGTRMRQETPSTARWWIVSRRRPGCALPASNHVACSMRPASGSRRAAAAREASAMSMRRPSSCKPTVSMRRRHSLAPKADTGGISSCQPIPLCAALVAECRCMRSASCWSSKACRAVTRWSCCTSAGTCSSIDWL